ncbi:hypothetical protein HMPREF3187_01635 [Aerococcus christensenii]|uniref:Uncharacterized protein n=1 Tax=Aerococcus christensenii TaxID=87541 RepID=A0A133XS34_9LACT|nr:hypothetical protein HMPREF3187_01635 [Aerococcus christensenii]
MGISIGQNKIKGWTCVQSFLTEEQLPKEHLKNFLRNYLQLFKNLPL